MKNTIFSRNGVWPMLKNLITLKDPLINFWWMCGCLDMVRLYFWVFSNFWNNLLFCDWLSMDCTSNLFKAGKRKKKNYFICMRNYRKKNNPIFTSVRIIKFFILVLKCLLNKRRGKYNNKNYIILLILNN
jgi:hypothetical protein